MTEVRVYPNGNYQCSTRGRAAEVRYSNFEVVFLLKKKGYKVVLMSRIRVVETGVVFRLESDK